MRQSIQKKRKTSQTQIWNDDVVEREDESVKGKYEIIRDDCQKKKTTLYTRLCLLCVISTVFPITVYWCLYLKI